MRYCLADHGLVFSTRDRGGRILADLREKTADAPVTIDFSGVMSLSYSFVDEFIGQLLEDASTSGEVLPTFANVPPSAGRTIERSLSRRGVGPEAVLSQALEAA